MEKIGVRNVFLIIIAIGVVAAAFIFKTDGEPHKIFTAELQKQDLIVSESARESSGRDTDGDGVPDWKEVVEGTDPQNPNTFNVEGGDKAYITQKQKSGAEPSGDNAGILDDNLTLTERIGRGVLGEYIYARTTQNSDFSSPEDLIEYITNQALEINQPTVYSKEAFKTVTTNKSTLLLYANKLRELDRKYPDATLIQTGTSVIEAIESTGDENSGIVDEELVTRRVKANLAIYDNIISDLIAIEVPTSLLNEHINLTNSTVGIKWSLEQTAYTNVDPARALVGIQSFPEYALTIDLMYQAIVRKLATEGIDL